MADLETKKLKVCLVTGRMDAGGVPVNLVRFIKGLAPNFLVTMAAPPDAPYGLEALRLLGEKQFLKISHRRFLLRDVVSLIGFIRMNDIDVVSCHGKSGGLIGRLAAIVTGTPAVYFYHGVHYKSYGAFGCYLYFLIERVLAKFTKFIVAVSEDEAKLIEHLRLCSHDKLKTVLNGVPVDGEYSEPPESPPFRLIHITRFNDQKNSDLLLDIFDQLKLFEKYEDFYVEVLGDGEAKEREVFENKVVERGYAKQIKCIGAVSDCRPYFIHSHGLLSTSRWEGLPLGALECMAAARIPILTDVVGHRALAEKISALPLYPSEDATKAAELLARVANANNFPDKAIELQRAVSRDYSISQMIEGRCKVYIASSKNC